MAGVKKTKLRGCIKKSKGPWIVHRTAKDGGMVTGHCFPTENECRKNKQRERRWRAVSHNIFAGLKKHGNYKLPKHADTKDLLKALCEDAGCHVEDDKTIYRKKSVSTMETMVGSMIQSSCQVIEGGQSKDKIIIHTLIMGKFQHPKPSCQ